MSEEKKIVCQQCGQCCMVCDIRWEEITDKTKIEVLDRLHWLQLHRCDTQIFTHVNGRKFGVLRIPLVCKLLDQDKDGKFFCKDYEHRPQVCRKFLCPRVKREKGMPDKT